MPKTRQTSRADYSGASPQDDAPDDAPQSLSVPPEWSGLRVDQALARLYPGHSRTRLQAWLREGHITVDGAAPEAKSRVLGGERVSLSAPAESAADAGFRPQAMKLKIRYEDDALLVLDKPPGLVVHPGAGVRDGTLMNALVAHAPQLAGVPRAGIVHRLDKDTSGLMVVAKTLLAHTHLVRQLADRSVARTYLALVHGHPQSLGQIDAPIGRDSRVRTRMAVRERGREARTSYRVVKRFETASLLECKLDTGRTHQIRVHLQHLGHPLVGDPVYRRGARQALPWTRQALHACALEAEHPVSGERMRWRSRPPRDFQVLLDSLTEIA